MQFYLNQMLLYLTILLTGLSVGLFYTWQVSVIPGTKKINTKAYIETMQSINREILNPAFFLIFLGSFISLVLLCFSMVLLEERRLILVLASTVVYFVGPIGLTVLGNVPLNNKLDKISLDEKSSVELRNIRSLNEGKRNKFHLLRTALALISFTLLIAIVLI